MSAREGQQSKAKDKEAKAPGDRRGLCFSPVFSSLLTRNLIGPDSIKVRLMFWGRVGGRPEGDQWRSRSGGSARVGAGRPLLAYEELP